MILMELEEGEGGLTGWTLFLPCRYKYWVCGRQPFRTRVWGMPWTIMTRYGGNHISPLDGGTPNYPKDHYKI